MTTKDIRWKQRFNNYQRALNKLTDAVNIAKERQLSELEKQGLIQAFEYTHELAWKVLKDYLAHQGIFDIVGSRDASRHAFNQAIVTKGDIWMEMIQSRNLTSHTYNQDVADDIANKIVDDYLKAFLELSAKLLKKYDS